MDKSGALEYINQMFPTAIFEFASHEITSEFSSMEGTKGGAEMLLAVCQLSMAKRWREWY
ncbi:hypothetical protein C5167_007333 [Papaver somniferum]|nr:hypothetical protein C5167_007333 [Papaver somniferum]